MLFARLKFIVALFLLCFLQVPHFLSQNLPYLDRLGAIIESDAPDTVRLKAYKEVVGKLAWRGDSASLAERYIQEGMDLAEKLEQEEVKWWFYSYRWMLIGNKGDSYYDEARTFLNKLLRIAEEKNLPKIRTKVYMDLGHSYFNQADYDSAIPYLQKGISFYESLADKIDLDNPYEFLIRCYWMQKNYKQAIQAIDKSLVENRNRNDTMGLASDYNALGIMYSRQGKLREALGYYQKSLKQFEILRSKRSAATTLYNIGGIYSRLEKDALALEAYRKAMKIEAEIGNERMLHRIMASMGFHYLRVNQEDSAHHYFDKSLDYYGRIGDSVTVLQIYGALGREYASLGRIPRALDLYSEALKRSEALRDTKEMANLYRQLGDLYSSQENVNEAIAYQQQALESYSAIQDFSNIAETKNSMGKLFLETQSYDKALIYSSEALQQFRSFQDSCEMSESYLIMGKAYVGLNRVDSAQYFLNASFPLADQCRRTAVSATGYTALGRIYLQQGKEFSAITAFEKGLDFAKLAQNREVIKDAAEELYPLYQKRGKYKKAFETLSIYQSTKDSLFNQENTRTLVQKEMELAFEKQKQEETLAQQRVVERQRWINYGAILSSLFLIGLAFSFYRNVQNKKKANDLLNQQNKEIAEQKAELEQLDETKSRLFANISHELRTPLTLISSPIQHMLRRESDQLSAQHIGQLKVVERNAQQLKGLVNDILDLSKLESNKLELQEAGVALIPFLRRTANNFDSLTQHLGIHYQMTSGIPKDIHVLLDQEKVEKILNNLLSNAIKHTPSRGSVEFSAEQEGDKLRLQVKDTGRGIAEADLPHIFNRFFQSKNSHGSLQGGTGIGLALAKELSQLMNGTLSVESKLGTGSTFSLILPFREVDAIPVSGEFLDDVEVPAEESDLVPLQNGVEKGVKPHKVLIVEDHPDMQRFIQQLLDYQYETFVANHGNEALEILEKESIDLVVSDVMMPEMDGYTLLQELKNHPSYSAIPMVMLTALNDEDHRLQALTIGVDDYLGKPFSPEELTARVHNLLQRHEVRQMVAKEIQEEEKQREHVGVATDKQSLDQDVTQTDTDWLQQVEDIIRKELENPEFNIASLADQFFLSQRQFQRKMKKMTGLTPKKFQQEVALQEARKLLENRTYSSVKAIAYTVGMSNVWRFSQQFQDRFGKRPSEYL